MFRRIIMFFKNWYHQDSRQVKRAKQRAKAKEFLRKEMQKRRMKK